MVKSATKVEQPKEETTPVKAEILDSGGKVIGQTAATSTALALPNAPEAALDRFRGSGAQQDNRVSLPRIAVMQPMSQEVNRTDDPEPRGTLFNRLTKENYGKTITIIPLGNYTARVRMVQNVGLACRSRDMFIADMPGGQTYEGAQTHDCTACKFKDWPTDRRERGDKTVDAQAKKPECGVTNNYPALLIRADDKPEDYELILLSMASSSAGAAADLNGMQLISMSPWQNFVYELYLGEGKAPNGTPYWYQQVKRIRKTNAEERTKAVSILSFLAGKQLNIEETEEDGAAAPAGPADPAAAQEARY